MWAAVLVGADGKRGARCDRARFTLPNQQSDAKSGRILHKAMTETFPQLTKPRVDYCWAAWSP
jgi:glycine/D-amino acid oxidase-like deaminating enzyme